MVVTANESVPVYEAVNKELTRWTYRGECYGMSKHGIIECPSMVRLGGKDVLFYSANKTGTLYLVGQFDPETAKYTVEKEGFLNHTIEHYAVYPANLPDGRLILYAMLMEDRDYRVTWRTGLAMTRECTMSDDGEILQWPIREMKKLRGKKTKVAPFNLYGNSKVIEGIKGDSVEIVAEIKPGSAKAFGLKVHLSDDRSRYSIIRFEGESLMIGSKRRSYKADETVKLRVFVDKGCLDVFTGDGLVAETRLMYPQDGDYGVSFFAEGGDISVKLLEAWEMNSIYK